MNDIDNPKHEQAAHALQSVYNAKDTREAEELYDSWAQDYEQNLASWGYSTPAIAAWFFGRYVGQRDGAVLDAGAGTGIMGELLAPLGYRDLAGIDISQRMLDHARTKGVYKDLRRMELGGPLELPTDAFAAVVSAGVFAPGHAPPESFEELVRVTEPGGHVIFSVRTDAYAEGGFEEKQEALEREGRWRLVGMTEPFAHQRFRDPELKVRVFAYQVR